MAKLHKIEMFILDINENYGSLANVIADTNDRLESVSLHPFNVQTVDLNWHDEHRLNFLDATYEDFVETFAAGNGSTTNKTRKQIW
jgi:hypothetical protein